MIAPRAAVTIAALAGPGPSGAARHPHGGPMTGAAPAAHPAETGPKATALVAHVQGDPAEIGHAAEVHPTGGTARKATAAIAHRLAKHRAPHPPR